MKEILTHKLSRRDALKAGLALGLGFTTRLSNTPRAVEAHKSNVYTEAVKYLESPQSVENAMALAWTMADDLEKITPSAPLIRTMKDVLDFRDEFVPYLALIGFQTSNKLVYPTIKAVDFGDTYQSVGDFYLFGASHCGTNPYTGEKADGAIQINERYLMPYSSLQKSENNHMLVSTLAHEICHSNNVSCAPVSYFGDLDMVEGTTQIASTNALMAMAMGPDGGSRISLPAALGQVKRMAKGYVLVGLSEADRLDEYDQFLYQFPRHSEEQGDWHIIQAQGEGIVSGYVSAANDYGKRPFEVMGDAMIDKDFKTKELPVPTKTLSLAHTQYVLANLSHFIDDYLQASPQ
ncbi:MAG: hypothetical protein HYT11_02680 [Candidatus Levybacteria bacterium]|nr:hypothetical protein [Candidatus Levybacteria bacterium]